jgi:DNA replication licensing factor MCM5
LSKQYFCDVDMSHLIQYDEELAQKLNNEPADYIPLVYEDSSLPPNNVR